MAAEAANGSASTQNTQYDMIGTKYNSMHDLPAVQPEKPSVIAALGDVTGMRCLDLACGTGRYTHLLTTLGASSATGYDISEVMVKGAKAAYGHHPELDFSVADCSKPFDRSADPFDIVFAGWFLNYAGTEEELVSMFRNIEQNLKPEGRFIGITTNVNDKLMHEPKMDFYGLDIVVLDPTYKAPGTDKEIGIKARIVAKTEPVIQFDVYQLRKEIYERCAQKAGLKLEWVDAIVPDDERKGTGYWDRWLERPTFVILKATRA